MAVSNSSLKSMPARDRIREWIALARLSFADAGNLSFSHLQDSYLLHDGYARKYLGRPLTDCKVIEIGYGARPNRLIWFSGQGVDITGIDLDQPILRGRPSEFFQVYRRNGWERALKTVVRWVINERNLRRTMLAELSHQRRKPFELPADRLVVGDAANRDFWTRHRGADYVFSEDVFEHIPVAGLECILSEMAASMDPRGIAYVKPMVFTGICGGHQIEWFPHTLKEKTNRRGEPWEHLRQKRYMGNVYLNKLSLADYRSLFSKYFEILEATCTEPNLGSQFMTPAIREELRAYSDEELYSNGVIFLLRPLP